jgi:hypothetical protein
MEVEALFGPNVTAQVLRITKDIWYCDTLVSKLMDRPFGTLGHSLLRGLFEYLGTDCLKVLENNTMCIGIYIHIDHMFACLSIDECSFTIVGREYYGFPSCHGHTASI